RKLTRNPATSAIPVVMVTSKDQETDKVWGLRQGAVQYLMKPVDDIALVAAVQATLN
ncbi:MAG: response regulator, partial [Gammaproteobacteria bacterium]|nr:response regulator [Gammaproteobacteria bacterium]